MEIKLNGVDYIQQPFKGLIKKIRYTIFTKNFGVKFDLLIIQISDEKDFTTNFPKINIRFTLLN